ncbi:MAG: hypothetical protein AAGD22_13805 [Verrucomicrobiota bacterium]
MTSRSILTTLIILIALTTALETHAIILIDDFNGTFGPVTSIAFDDVTTLEGETDYIGISGTGGNNPTLTEGSGVGIIAATASSGSGGRAILTYDGNDDDPGGVSLFVGPVDLTEAGANDRFRLDINALTGPTVLDLSVFPQSGSGQNGIVNLNISGGAQILDIPFSSFSSPTAHLSNAGRISIALDFDPGESITINSISIIPEPSSVLFLTFAGTPLLFRRRR